MSGVINNLIDVLQTDWQVHKELAQVLENKLDAMRHYDLTRLESLGQNEQRLTQAIALNSSKRNQALIQATAMLMPGSGKRMARASELVESLQQRPEWADYAGQIMNLVNLLRTVTEHVQRLNNINKMATRKILGHFDDIFRIIAQGDRDIGLYGRSGKKSMLEQNRLVDAMA